LKDLGWLWHGLGGFGITAAIVGLMWLASGPCWVPFLMPALLLLGGYVRERWQHAWEPLNAHRWIEALAWPAGGVTAALVGLPLLV
jgi:hypothetical protein